MWDYKKSFCLLGSMAVWFCLSTFGLWLNNRIGVKTKSWFWLFDEKVGEKESSPISNLGKINKLKSTKSLFIIENKDFIVHRSWPEFSTNVILTFFEIHDTLNVQKFCQLWNGLQLKRIKGFSHFVVSKIKVLKSFVILHRIWQFRKPQKDSDGQRMNFCPTYQKVVFQLNAFYIRAKRNTQYRKPLKLHKNT